MFDSVLITTAGIIFVGLLAIGLIFGRLYKRSSKETSFVRTGFRGQQVVMNGGALVLPVLHEMVPVNMNTLRLDVKRTNEQALITKDRMRVDVAAEFYVRVQPTIEAISNAAQTLGQRTMRPEALKELVEGKFVDALRAVAAEMAMEEMHEQRVSFVQKVQGAVSEDILKNGLELESVSLTGLDQTSRDYFNPDNAFDAEGLTKLTQEIEERRKKRNDIEQETEVLIKRKNLEAEQDRLQITRDQEYARLEQQREIQIRQASQTAQIATETAEREREAEEAKINARQQVNEANIVADQVIEERQIAMQQQVREKEILKEQALEAAGVEKAKMVELAEQDRSIAVAQKSKAKSEAEAEADKARALAAKAEEEVSTARETVRAERAKTIELIEAKKVAEKQAIGVTVAAEAEKLAAEDLAEAVQIEAEAQAKRVLVAAEGEAKAAELKAQAERTVYEVDAQGKRAINEAANLLSAEQIAMQIKMKLIETLPAIIAESVKPIENIDGIKIVQVGGLATGPGSSSVSTASVGAGDVSLPDQVVNSALRYRSQAPLLDAIMKEVGFQDGDIAKVAAGLAGGSAGVDLENAISNSGADAVEALPGKSDPAKTDGTGASGA